MAPPWIRDSDLVSPLSGKSTPLLTISALGHAALDASRRPEAMKAPVPTKIVIRPLTREVAGTICVVYDTSYTTRGEKP